MKNLIFPIFFLLSYSSFSQNNEERTAVIKVVDQMFDAMRAGDSAAIRAIFHPQIIMRTIFTDKNGNSLFAVETAVTDRADNVLLPPFNDT